MSLEFTHPLLDIARNTMKSPSKRLIASYVLDWISIAAIFAIGGALNYVSPKKRAFSLLNLDISFPLVVESISTTTLVLVALLAPAVIITFITLILVPGRPVAQGCNRAQIIRLKLWELEKGLAGLALSVAVSFFITQGLKNLFGKPRPDLLARCDPDLTNIADHVVGGFGQDISARWTMVTYTICKQTDMSVLDDGFKSFPSGHSSWSWSGLLYLSLFLCSKFAIAIPHLPLVPPGRESTAGNQSHSQELLPLHANGQRQSSEDAIGSKQDWPMSAPPVESHVQSLWLRDSAATPPNYLLILALIPVAVAFYIVSTPYAEYYHFGFDVISGSLIGILTSWFSFRWYHLPISRGQGWAWGPRSKDRAFAIGVGTGGYVGDDERSNSRSSAKGTDGAAGIV